MRCLLISIYFALLFSTNNLNGQGNDHILYGFKAGYNKPIFANSYIPIGVNIDASKRLEKYTAFVVGVNFHYSINRSYGFLGQTYKKLLIGNPSIGIRQYFTKSDARGQLYLEINGGFGILSRQQLPGSLQMGGNFTYFVYQLTSGLIWKNKYIISPTVTLAQKRYEQAYLLFGLLIGYQI